VLPAFRQVLDCASPLALWLPLQKWVHGTDARPMLEVEAIHEPGRAALLRRPLPVSRAARQRRPAKFMVPMRDNEIVEALHEPER